MTSTFCRHNRFLESCPICSKKARTRPGTVAGQAAARASDPAPRTGAGAPSARASAPTPRKRSTRSASQVVVRRVARAVDDGYASELVPGLRASADAERLAAELVWSAERLDELRTAPPGLYGEIAAIAASEPEEAAWWVFLTAWLSPLEGGDDPFAAIRAAHVPWSSGELPALDGAPSGPRGAAAGSAARPGSATPRPGAPVRPGAAATITAYRAWAARSGGQRAGLAGEAALDPGRRFDRAYERLSLPGLGRLPRYELVLLAGALGLVEAVPTSLQLSDAVSPVTVAAKRVFGIGDPVLIARRAGELAAATGVELAAFDLALQSWSAAERITAGATIAEDPDPERRARVAAALGV